MKKALLTVLVLAAFTTGCKKESGQCYSCSYGVINGYQRPPDTYCGDLSTYKPKDAAGNELQYYCQPK